MLFILNSKLFLASETLRKINLFYFSITAKVKMGEIIDIVLDFY